MDSISVHFRCLLGVDIIRNSLRVPITQIVKNTGVNPTQIVEKVVSSQDVNLGYDALTSQYVDMFKSGIIDPTKVIRLQLLTNRPFSQLLPAAL